MVFYTSKNINLALLIFLILSIFRTNFSFDLIQTIPHDSSCFTQGLVYHEQYLFESCGLNGQSLLKKIDHTTGKVLATYKFENDVFAEGITYYDNYIFVLTYHNKKMFIMDANDLHLVSTRHFTCKTGEGWGLTHDGRHLILSDGSSHLHYYHIPTNYSLHMKEHPHVEHHTLQLDKVVKVKLYTNKQEVEHINELEFAHGHIYANVWYQDVVIKIEPKSGYIVHVYDMSTLFPHNKRPRHADCLNGIAYYPPKDQFYLTGKFWPYAYIGTFSNTSDVNITRRSMLDML